MHRDFDTEFDSSRGGLIPSPLTPVHPCFPLLRWCIFLFLGQGGGECRRAVHRTFVDAHLCAHKCSAVQCIAFLCISVDTGLCAHKERNRSRKKHVSCFSRTSFGGNPHVLTNDATDPKPVTRFPGNVTDIKSRCLFMRRLSCLKIIQSEQTYASNFLRDFVSLTSRQ